MIRYITRNQNLTTCTGLNRLRIDLGFHSTLKEYVLDEASTAVSWEDDSEGERGMVENAGQRLYQNDWLLTNLPRFHMPFTIVICDVISRVCT